MVIILKEKKDKSFNICLILFRLISVVIIIICLILLYNWHKENTENSSLSDELSDSFITATSEVTPKSESDTSENSSTTYESIEVNFEDLLSQNPQTVGWIKVNNTNINFPIVQSQDNNFYLKHNFKKNYNSAGWIFADYTNNFLKKSEISDLENYLWLFTKSWPTIYEVQDKNEKISLQIIGQ